MFFLLLTFHLVPYSDMEQAEEAQSLNRDTH